MTIVVNDIAATDGGALSVISDFYRFIRNDDEAKKIQWIFLLNKNLFEETSNINIYIYIKGRFNWLKRIWFDNYIINRICRENNVDGILSFQNTISFTSKLPQMVYMHQVIPFQKEKNFSFLKKNECIYAIYQHIIGFLIKKSVEKANFVVVQADWLKELIVKETSTDSSKIIVNNLDYKISNHYKSPEEHFDPEYFFYPAFESIYKNQDVIRKACAILQKENINTTVELTIDSIYPESSLIRSCGKLSHEEVMMRYYKSTLIFPSYIETIGLPLVEAMSANTIILAADCQYAHETLKDYPNSYYFNPFAPEELALLMKKIINGQIKKIEYTSLPTSKSDWNNVISTFSKYILATK